MNITKGSCNWIFELPQLGRDAQPIPMQSATCYVISLCHTRTHAHTHTWRGCKCDNIRIFNSQKLGPNLRQTDNRNFLSLLRLLLRFFFQLVTSSWGMGLGVKGSQGPLRSALIFVFDCSKRRLSLFKFLLTRHVKSSMKLSPDTCEQDKRIRHISTGTGSGRPRRRVYHVGSAELCMCVTLP